MVHPAFKGDDAVRDISIALLPSPLVRHGQSTRFPDGKAGFWSGLNSFMRLLVRAGYSELLCPLGGPTPCQKHDFPSVQALRPGGQFQIPHRSKPIACGEGIPSAEAQQQGRLGRQSIRVNKCLTYQTASIR